MNEVELIDLLLKNRQIKIANRRSFLNPDYQIIEKSDPFLLPDMKKAIDRLEQAYHSKERILVYGDYDSDGVTSTALLIDAFDKLGFKSVSYHLPNRFKEGYGMNADVIKSLSSKLDLIVTVDCGSMNHQEIDLAKKAGIDVIVTDHHSINANLPDAVAVVNPNRANNNYPNRSLAGVGVAFNLVRALQTRLKTWSKGQEKWLLDLVAIGTISDLMPLTGNNRVAVKYGLEVLKKTRRPGIKYLLTSAGLDGQNIGADTVAFGLGPRFNAAGRLETAELSLDVLMAQSALEAKKTVEKLNYLNQKRRALQDKITTEACQQAEGLTDDVLILVGKDWHEGVVGIVASKIMEQFSKPVFVLQEKNGWLKGSARSFGDFSIAEAISNVANLVESGGGHAAAGGVKLKATRLDEFRQKINQFYYNQNLSDQLKYLEPKVDAVLANLEVLNLKFYYLMSQMEPFGVGNPEPVFKAVNLRIRDVRRLGKDGAHLKLTLLDELGKKMDFLGFGLVESYPDLAVDDEVDVVFNVVLNTWQGREAIEGRIISLALSN